MKISVGCLLLASSWTCVRASAEVDERQVLLAFYEATGGHAWNQNSGWEDQSNDICNWFGVICRDEETQEGEAPPGNVIGLSLPSNFLNGRTPPALWTLPSLAQIDFSKNPYLDVDFSGLQSTGSPLQTVLLRATATTSVGGIAAVSATLVEVDLSESRIDSQIPVELYSLTNLNSLTLADCGLLGSVPEDIQRLSLLKELDLFENSLTGSLPNALSSLVHLRYLSLSSNQFHGIIPVVISNLVMLREFWAHNNDLTGSIPSFSKAPNIHKIYLNNNALTGEIPSDFLQATVNGMEHSETIHINLASNALSGSVPATLDSLEDLEILWMLGDNEWTHVPTVLCDNIKWNEGSINQFACRGFLCPPLTFSRHGFQTPDTSCQPCKSADFYGATTCFDKDDRSVLMELHVQLKGEKWDRADNWLMEDDFCKWYGVECWNIGDAKDGRVRKILLPNNNLLGTVPETLYSMQHLTTIDFSRNEIILPFLNIAKSDHMFSINVAGTRTKDYDGIENANEFFRELYADHTPISGSIPSEIMGVETLRVLSLQGCDLSGELSEEIFSLTDLRELYLADNSLRGNLPDLWDELENLEVLGLAKNRFTGPLPSSLDRASSLIAVSLQDQTTKGGGLSGAVPSLSTTTTVRTLLLANNRLEGDLPENLLTGVDGNLPVTVDLSYNLVTGKLHGTYDRFKKMNFYVEGNFISEVDETLCSQANWMQGGVREFGCDAILCPSGTMGGRRAFTDSVCSPCDQSANSFLGQASCTKDPSMGLSERDILELLHDTCGGTGWHALDNWMSERSVCDWYGIGCDESGSVTSVQLGGNQLTGSFPTAIYLLPKLSHLKVYSNQVYFSFDGIENAQNLKTLGLDNTGLTSLRGIGRARSLEELHVAFNKLSGPLPEEFSRLVNLRVLDVSRNSLNGYLPYWLRSLVSLTSFSVAHNKFNGPIYDFRSLSELVYVDLSHNQFSGSVPGTLFQQASRDKKLVADLSSNSLTGLLPAELSGLPRLSLLVQNNQIMGIDAQLCEIEGWNDGAVKIYGCDAILCPAGTWNPLGRQTSEDSACVDCGKSKFMGSTRCGRSSSATYSTATTSPLVFAGLSIFLSSLFLL